MNNAALTLLLAGSAIALATSCNPTRTVAASVKTDNAAAPAAKSFADAWDVTIAGTPMGTVTGVLTVTETDGALGGTLRAQGQTLQLKSVNRTADGMDATFYYPDAGSDVTIELEGEETADVLSGETMGQFMTTATRKE